MQSAKLNLDMYPDYWESLLNWSNQFQYAAVFHPQQTEKYPFGAFQKSIAVGTESIPLSSPYFNSLKKYITNYPEKELYGYLGYDLKNELEELKSDNPSCIDWLPMDFFHPVCILLLEKGKLIIKSNQLDFYQKEIEKVLENKNIAPTENLVVGDFKRWTSKEDYLRTVNKLKHHIEEGDIYEINFCMNFSASVQNFNPIHVFQALCRSSPAPFGSLLKMGKHYIISASPERFLKLNRDTIISQPIKGTAARGKTQIEDNLNKKKLRESEKERAENMMIVDLVRNDLAKSAKTGSVKVEEIFGIYSFQQVHQMISTISAIKKEEVHPVDVIKNAFPMGSMTGAPKISAMQLSEIYENHKRNVFSGSVGYFRGEKEFDFNVLIRSIYYDEENKVLNYQVGSAITHDSDGEDEYKECLLKAAAIERILGII